MRPSQGWFRSSAFAFPKERIAHIWHNLIWIKFSSSWRDALACIHVHVFHCLFCLFCNAHIWRNLIWIKFSSSWRDALACIHVHVFHCLFCLFCNNPLLMSCNPLCLHWLYFLRHACYVVGFNLFAARFHPRPPLSTAMDTKIQALHQAGRAALEKAAKFLPKDAEAPPEVLRCECRQRSCVVELNLILSNWMRFWFYQTEWDWAQSELCQIEVFSAWSICRNSQSSFVQKTLILLTQKMLVRKMVNGLLLPPTALERTHDCAFHDSEISRRAEMLDVEGPTPGGRQSNCAQMHRYTKPSRCLYVGSAEKHVTSKRGAPKPWLYRRRADS